MPPKRYRCPRAFPTPRLDGSLEGPVWDAAPWTDDFVDIEGDAKPSPRFRTRAKMLWDDACLYIGAEMEEPDVWATLTERDSVIFHDNDFEVFLDPDGDAKSYFEIEVNALNTIWDLWLPIPYRDGGQAVNEWDCEGLVTAVQVRGPINDPSTPNQGWSVALAIPFLSLEDRGGRPCPPSVGDVWRINFSRVEWLVDVVEGKYVKRADVAEDNWVWSPQGVVDMHQPEQWGYLEFA